MVPPAGTPYSWSEMVQAVPPQPPIYAARAPMMAASAPWARREPNSSTVRPRAARTMRLALVAMRLWWLMVSRVKVSISCASMAGARTTTRGSLGNTGVPSGTA